MFHKEMHLNTFTASPPPAAAGIFLFVFLIFASSDDASSDDFALFADGAVAASAATRALRRGSM